MIDFEGLLFGENTKKRCWDQRYWEIYNNSASANRQEAKQALDAIVHDEIREVLDILESQMANLQPIAEYDMRKDSLRCPIYLKSNTEGNTTIQDWPEDFKSGFLFTGLAKREKFFSDLINLIKIAHPDYQPRETEDGIIRFKRTVDSITFILPDEPIAQHFLYSGHNIKLEYATAPNTHIRLEKLHREIVQHGVVVLGPAFPGANDAAKECDLGSPSEKPPYNDGVIGVYVHPFHKERLGANAITLGEALAKSKKGLECYALAARYAQNSYNATFRVSDKEFYEYCRAAFGL